MFKLTAKILANLNWRPSVLKRPLKLADGIILFLNLIRMWFTFLSAKTHEFTKWMNDSRGCQWTTCQLCVWSGSNRNAVIFSLNTIAFFATGATLAVRMRNAHRRKWKLIFLKITKISEKFPKIFSNHGEIKFLFLEILRIFLEFFD